MNYQMTPKDPRQSSWGCLISEKFDFDLQREIQQNPSDIFKIWKNYEIIA